MECRYACNSVEHQVARRSFLSSMAVGGGALASGLLSGLVQPAVARELKSQQKRILVIFLAGGVSQLESWDPKPGTDTGGPFRAIPTSVPGTHISELLPYTAQQMHHLSLIRSINTKNNDHGVGSYQMTTGRRKDQVTDYPRLGAVMAKLLEREKSPLPGHIQILPSERGSGARSNDAAYLGPRYNSVSLIGGQPPQNTTRPKSLTLEADLRRNKFREQANQHFAEQRRTAATDAYTYSYEQSLQLLAERDVFDASREPAKDHDRYGKHEFGRHCLLARRLLENDIPYVQVTHTNYDTHHENFDYHIEQLGEFDRPFATLIEDLADRGLLKHTLVIVMSEFGRTPVINQRYGRDHWGKSWSIALGGCGIQPGAVIGKTNANGTEVTDREVDHGHLFHTYLQAVGVDSSMEFDLGGRTAPVADPARDAIEELLS